MDLMLLGVSKFAVFHVVVKLGLASFSQEQATTFREDDFWGGRLADVILGKQGLDQSAHMYLHVMDGPKDPRPQILTIID